jgi:hypothetical protein
MTTQQLYQKVLNEQMTESEFLWHVRRNPTYNDMLTNTMSYKDTVSKLKGKGHISEPSSNSEIKQGFNFFTAFRSLQESHSESKKNQLKGGKGDKLTADDVNYYEFTKGWKHELEHTDDIDKAKEIAIDHLAEDPNYYTRLEMIEFKAKKKNRTDLPIEIKKSNFKDKGNQMKNAPKKKAPKKDK